MGYEANLLVPEHEGNFINFFALQERVSVESAAADSRRGSRD